MIFWILGITFLLLAVVILRMIIAEAKKFQMTYYKIKTTIPGQSKAEEILTRFVVLSDLHNHVYGNDNEKLLEEIDKVHPEFVIIAGDMMTSRPGKTLEIALSVIRRLAEKYPIYYGSGNHEQRLSLYPEEYPGLAEQFEDAVNQYGVHWLRNESEEINIGVKKLVICGLEIARKYYKRITKVEMDKSYLDEVIGEKTDAYTILIAHNPEYFDTYAQWGADLVLSGHIHGGMVSLPFLGGVISPKVRLFPKYDAGLFKKENSIMLLSRGLGMHTIPVRLWNRAEVLVVDLITGGEGYGNIG